jgi:hypothetical protein
MASPTFIDFYDNFPDQLGDEQHDLEVDTINLMLHTTVPTASWTADADVTNELSGTGYTTGGEALDNVTFGVDSTDKAKLDSDGETITAGAGGLTFSHWSLINATSDKLICYGTCDGGSNIVLADGESFTLNPDGTNGWFRIGVGTLS